MLPVLFIVLACAALVAALAALFSSLRTALGGGRDRAWAASGPDRGALEDEKNALLRALKDLEYEHEVGKIDDEDFARLERAYRARAKEVLGELDRDLRPYLSRAEELASGIGGRTEKKRKKKGKKAEAASAGESASPSASANASPSASPSASASASANASPSASESASPSESESASASTVEPATKVASSGGARRVCSKCSTENDLDARFCKQCAAPLLAGEAS